MEGEFVRVAAPVSGQLLDLAVTRGAVIAAGVPLFTLESASESAAVAEASAKLARAESQLENLKKGKRPVEMDMLQAQLAQAEAMWQLATANRARQEKLALERTVSAATLDEARSTESNARARVSELRSALEQGRLGARDDEISAATSDVEAARRALAQEKWKLDQKVQIAPAAGQVTDTYFRPGEMVAAGTPVVEMLPPENVKARFFVPQEKLALRPARHRGADPLRRRQGDACARASCAWPPRPSTRRRTFTAAKIAPTSSSWWRRNPTIRPTPPSCRRACPWRSPCEWQRRRARHRRPRADQELQRPARGRRFLHARRARPHLRLSRAERQRQDDDHPHVVRAAHARRRRGHLPRTRPAHARPDDQDAGRLHDAALQPLR